MLSALKQIANASNKGLSWHVREACIDYLKKYPEFAHTEFPNPSGRGSRTDLKKPSNPSVPAPAAHSQDELLKTSRKLRKSA